MCTPFLRAQASPLIWCSRIPCGGRSTSPSCCWASTGLPTWTFVSASRAAARCRRHTVGCEHRNTFGVLQSQPWCLRSMKCPIHMQPCCCTTAVCSCAPPLTNPILAAVRQAIAKALVAFYQKFVDEAAKREIKNTLMEFDRTLLVADPRRPEPKKYVMVVCTHMGYAHHPQQVWWSRRPRSLPKVVPLRRFGGGFCLCNTHTNTKSIERTHRNKITDAQGRVLTR